MQSPNGAGNLKKSFSTFSTVSSFAFLLRRGVKTRARFSGGGGVAGVAGVPRALDLVRRPPSNEPPNAFNNSSLSTRARSNLLTRFDDVDFVGVLDYTTDKPIIKKKKNEKTFISSNVPKPKIIKQKSECNPST